MIKDLAVNLSIGRDVAGPYAIGIAELFGAHVAGIAFRYEPVIPPSIAGSFPASYIDAQRAENDQAADVALANFEAAARRAGVSFESRALSASLAGAADRFGAIARRFDLAVVGQAEPDKVAPEELIVEAALFSSGRPVLVVPYIQKDAPRLGRVMVGWDASRSAARAIADAMPFLSRAKAIDIVVVTGERDKSGEITGTNMRRHLARHGIEVNLKHITGSGTDVQNAILSHAADSGADFMVMGGYHHSRLREFILGGVTRGILKSMTVPVFMSR